MAILTNADYQMIKAAARRSSIWPTLVAWEPTKQMWYDLTQQIEDWFVGGFNQATPTETMKVALETVYGSALTNAQAQAIILPWLDWKRSNF